MVSFLLSNLLINLFLTVKSLPSNPMILIPLDEETLDGIFYLSLTR